MKHLFTQTRFRFADLSGILVMLWICLASMHGLKASGQNVTISPSSGNLIAGLTYTGEVGFEQGWSSLWRHNQLPLPVATHPACIR